MSLRVIMFGKLVDVAGNSVSVDDAKDTNELINILNRTYPALADTKYVIAVNKKVINQNTTLDNNSEIALLPPFSGG
jgi:molybdopterin synthase sulfur carrier subunit